MSACAPFTLEFTQSPQELTERAKRALDTFGGTLDGDETGGNIEVKTPVGKVDATYVVQGQSITITITDKPMFLPCSMVEDQLRKALG